MFSKNTALHLLSLTFLAQPLLFTMNNVIRDTKKLMSELVQEKEFKRILNAFAGKDPLYKIKKFTDDVRIIEFKEKSNLSTFFGIHKDEQEIIDFERLRERILKKLGLKKGAQIIEIIGDATKFDPSVTEYMQDFFKKQFGDNCCIEYGYTGYRKSGAFDANSIVNDYLEKNPERASHVLANIVGHTIDALEKWGCTVPSCVKNFVFVYNENGSDEGYTKFGDDVIASDYMLDPKYDKMICFDGDCQCFKQVVNALARGIHVDLIGNLRTKEYEKKCLSTATLFYSTKKLLEENKELSKKEARAHFDKYCKSLDQLWDKNEPDHETKEALLEKACNEFIVDEIYKKIPSLCTFYNMEK